MLVKYISSLKGTDREVECPRGDFTSYRFLLAKDGMGFSVHKTVVRRGTTQPWHYKHHLESCYCVIGKGWLKNLDTGEKQFIVPDTLYALDKHDRHELVVLTRQMVLISVFNPPIKGTETHQKDGSYESV